MELQDMPLPDWALGLNQAKDLDVGTQLCTKDSGQMGNAHIEKILRHEEPMVFLVRTDAGSTFTSNKEEIHELFYIGPYFIKPVTVSLAIEKNRRQTIIERIESRCNIVDTGFILDSCPSPCHLWTGPHSGEGRGGGYGRMSLNSQTVAVHLVVFAHYHGYIPGKKQVDHLCNQRLCCNPAHLELVSHLKNQRRRAKRAKA